MNSVASNQYLKTFSSRAPKLPGVYQFLDQQREILYIGKAKNLQSRLRSYSQKDLDKKTEILVAKIKECVLTVTANEQEALLLEQRLIREHKPPYNILLKDDKSYPYIVLTDHQFPEIKVFRGDLRTAQFLQAFGPYPNAELAKKTRDIFIDLFQLRTCSDHDFHSRRRPCLQYQIGRCSAPCVGYISREDYRGCVQEVGAFLGRSSSQLIALLVKNMKEYSEKEDFETAQRFREHIEHLRAIEPQSSEYHHQRHRLDVLSYQWPYMHHLMIAQNQIISSRFSQIQSEIKVQGDDFLESVMEYLYSPLGDQWLPEILIFPLAESHSINVLGKNILVRSPEESGEFSYAKVAKESLWENIHQRSSKKDFFLKRLERLRQVLGFDHLSSIDCLDVSHFSGEYTAAGVVRLGTEGFEKKLFRKYNIKHEKKSLNDDCYSVYQAQFRHFKQAREKKRLPSLMLIDGGKGQLKAAMRAKKDLGITTPILAMAKGKSRRFGQEILYSFDESTQEFSIVDLLPTDSAFHLLAQLRDEAHRFSIRATRKKIASKAIYSPLDDIPHLGSRKKKILLEYFGGWQGIEKATYEQFLDVPGIGPKLAKALEEFLKKF